MSGRTHYPTLFSAVVPFTLLFGLFGFAVQAFAGVEEDWQKVQALDAPVAEKFHTRDEAVRIATARLNQQEPLLRSFIATYPGDPRSLDARLRLAHLLAVRSDLQNAPALYRAAMKLLGTLEDDPGTAPARKPDVAFAIISPTCASYRNRPRRNAKKSSARRINSKAAFPGIGVLPRCWRSWPVSTIPGLPRRKLCWRSPEK